MTLIHLKGSCQLRKKNLELRKNWTLKMLTGLGRSEKKHVEAGCAGEGDGYRAEAVSSWLGGDHHTPEKDPSFTLGPCGD